MRRAFQEETLGLREERPPDTGVLVRRNEELLSEASDHALEGVPSRREVNSFQHPSWCPDVRCERSADLEMRSRMLVSRLLATVVVSEHPVGAVRIHLILER